MEGCAPYDSIQSILGNTKKSSETTYTLINKHRISSATIDKLRKNKPMTTTTINDLCKILDCKIQDIAEYVPSEEDQIL